MINMKSTTHDEFAKMLHDHNSELTIMSKFTGLRNKIIVKDIDNITYNVVANSLLINIQPRIVSAINRIEAFNIKMHKIFPNLRIIDEYIAGNVKMRIIDDLGIEYFVKPESVLLGRYPSIETAIDKNKAFALKAKVIHGDRYDYSQSIYFRDKVKLKIICKDHGAFEQQPNAHIKCKAGCPVCNIARGWSKTQWLNYGKDKDCLVYIIKCFNNDEEFIKIGMTTQTTKKRFNDIRSMPYNYEVIKEHLCSAEEAWSLEKEYHQKFKEYKYLPKITFHGIQECFNINTLKNFNL